MINGQDPFEDLGGADEIQTKDPFSDIGGADQEPSKKKVVSQPPLGGSPQPLQEDRSIDIPHL